MKRLVVFVRWHVDLLRLLLRAAKVWHISPFPMRAMFEEIEHHHILGIEFARLAKIRSPYR